MRRVNWWAAYLLVLGVFSIGAGELFLRLTWSDPSDRYYVWPPHTRKEFHRDPKHLPGVSPATIMFETNSLGLRGREPSQLDGFRVLALGGSTTESLYSDTEYSWPGQLELLLTKRYPRLHPWVGNAGRSAQSSIHLALHVEHLPSGLPPLDAIVIFLGVTDLALATCWSAPCDYPRELIEQIAFALRPNPNARFYERPMLYRLARRWIEYIKKRGVVQTDDGAWMTELRLLRAQAEQLIDKPRDLSRYINSEMKPNLRRIANSAGRQGIPLILVTQTVMWKPNQTAEEDAILFVGGAGYHGDYVHRKVPLVYFTAGALRVMMEQINAATLEICRETKTVCVHASPEISGRFEYFYDDCHMNDAGLERLAQLILPAITNLVERRLIEAP